MSKKRKNLFIMLLIAVLTIIMAVPVSATTTKQRKKASLKLFNKVYSTFPFGTESTYDYTLDINNDGYPEHIKYVEHAYDVSKTGNIIYIYTIDNKYKTRKYVFNDVTSTIYRSGKYLIFEKMDGKYKGHNKYTYKVYSVKNGKLKLVKNKKYSTVIYVGYFKNGKKCSYDTYYNVVGKLTRYTLKSSSYWSKLFNATRNFG